MSERLAAGTLGEMRLPDLADAERNVRGAFDWMDKSGRTSDECWSDYMKKLEHLRSSDAPRKIADAVADWATHAEVLDDLLETPENIVRALREAGAPARFSELDHTSDPADVVWAIQNCHLMRDRFSIADLAFLTGAWTADDVADALAEAERIGAGL